MDMKISSPVSSRFNKFKKIIMQRYLMNLWYGIRQFNAILVLFALPCLVNSSSIVCIMHRSIRFILFFIIRQRMSVERCYKIYEYIKSNLIADTFWVSSVFDSYFLFWFHTLFDSYIIFGFHDRGDSNVYMGFHVIVDSLFFVGFRDSPDS